MSQALFAETAETKVEPVVQQRFSEAEEEFYYRPFSALAVVSLFLGLCSVIALMTVFGLSVALFGVILGLVAFVQTSRSQGEVRGKWLAFVGMTISFLLFSSGTALHAYNYNTEVPDGFERINFTHDISRKGFIQKQSAIAPHPDVQALDGKPIFLKGYMYPTRKTKGLQSFVLVKDTGQCCFGGKPKVWDMIRIVMKEGGTVDYREGMVSIAGTFHVQGQGKDNTGLSAVYQIDGEYLESSRFSF